MSQRYTSILDMIGRTPVLRINRAVDPRFATLWAKIESRNPGGSIKDRVAASMVAAAEAEGRIEPGRTTIFEATSGNTGIGLAMVCAVRGYRLVLAMPDDVSVERRKLLGAYGAEGFRWAGGLNLNADPADLTLYHQGRGATWAAATRWDDLLLRWHGG